MTGLRTRLTPSIRPKVCVTTLLRSLATVEMVRMTSVGITWRLVISYVTKGTDVTSRMSTRPGMAKQTLSGLGSHLRPNPRPTPRWHLLLVRRRAFTAEYYLLYVGGS